MNYQHLIPFERGKAQAFGRATIVVDGTKQQMWYSFRGAPPMKYRIGYAESTDGESWQSLNHLAGISPSDTGWDSEMIEYPFVLLHKGKKYMLYNGNNYGLTGFGLAIWG